MGEIQPECSMMKTFFNNLEYKLSVLLLNSCVLKAICNRSGSRDLYITYVLRTAFQKHLGLLRDLLIAFTCPQSTSFFPYTLMSDGRQIFSVGVFMVSLFNMMVSLFNNVC